jgi:predicted Zn-dependent peptidase
VPKDKVEESVEVILAGYKKMMTELVTEEELKRAKDLFAGRLAIQLESSDDVANWYARQAVMRQDMIDPEEFLRQVKAVTPKDIQRVAKKIFVNQGLNLAVISGQADEAKLKNILKF